jgi:hydroxyethylthiazole kinase-like sugar kinase family protein
MQGNGVEKADAFSAADRVTAYLERLEELKRGNVFREVMEERVFLEFIRVNRDRINEFPLLEIEQKSLIDILLRRGADHPGHQYIKGLIAEFLAVVNRYGKARGVGAGEEAEARLKELSGAEAFLVKCVQGAVYACSLIKDNASDAVIMHFGESSLHEIEEITERCEFDESWWQALLDTFVRDRIARAHAGIVAGEKYTVFREGGFIGVRLPFDAVLATLRGTDKTIQKTRVQSAYDAQEEDPGNRPVAAALAAFLGTGPNPLVQARTPAPVLRHLARIAAMDTAGRDHAAAGPPDSDEAEARNAFLAAQAMALCVGAGLVQAVALQDFERAVRDFEARERRILLSRVGNFERERLERLVPLVLEFAYLGLLRDMGRDEGGKVVIRAMRLRRAVEAEVAALTGTGEGDLTRIGRRRLFEAEPDRPDMALWKPKTFDEMTGLCAVLQLAEPVTASLSALWEAAPFKVDFLVAVNLEAVAKVTANPAQRVAEILARFGVSPRRSVRPQAAGTPPPPDAAEAAPTPSPPPAGGDNQG